MRLEDAAAGEVDMANDLERRPDRTASRTAKPIPVYLIYQTAVTTGDQVVFYDDIYGKDRSMLASSGNGSIAAR